MRIHYLENLATAGIGNIATWVAERGYQLTGTQLHQKIEWPDPDDYDLLVVLGGVPQECEAWLSDEIGYLKQVIEAGKHVLGICLGSQLIAEALGGKLIPHTHAESGWWPVTLKEEGKEHPLLAGVEGSTPLFFFHRNTFTMPQGCHWLATTQGCAHQIFAYKEQVLGIQSHPEMLPETMKFLADNRRDHLPEGDFHTIKASDSSHADYVRGARAFSYQILDNMVASINDPRTAKAED
jgi:GMP synthase-like glutamine amidotransferase